MNDRSPSEPCTRVLGRLAELVDGGLPLLEEARDLGHLEACAACARAHADWLAFHVELSRALPRLALPAGLMDGLERQLESVRIAPTVAPTRATVWTSLLAAAASLVALFVLEALGTAMDADHEAPLFAPDHRLPALLPESLYDGFFQDLSDSTSTPIHLFPPLFPALPR